LFAPLAWYDALEMARRFIMQTIHARLIGDQAVVSRAQLEHLLELARRSEPVEVSWQEDDLPTRGMMGLAEQGGAFRFWEEAGEDLYTLEDGEALS
jgi:hypothetical protein